MADHGIHHATENPAMDYAEHEKTYKLFIALAKWGAISSAAVLIFMALTLL